MSRTSIETVTGEILDYSCPTKDMITVESIAVGISRQSRFCGQTVGLIPYTVAQHSVHVMGIVQAVMTPNTELNLKMQEDTSDEIREFLRSPSRLEYTRILAMFLGLFHDASEAFLCDIPTPAKRLPGLMEAYLAVESKLMEAIHDSIGIKPEMITPEIAAIVHWADQYALAVEAYHLVPSRGRGAEWAFLVTPCRNDVLMWEPPMKSPDAACQLFLLAYERLTTGKA